MAIEAKASTARKKALLLLNIILLSVGDCGGPLLMRLYFTHGGKRVWLTSWLHNIAWPLIFLPLTLTYFRRRRNQDPANPNNLFFTIKTPLFFASAAVGLLTGLASYLFAGSIARLPVTTAALIGSTHLVFTAAFAFLLVKQKFTSYSVNALVLLTIGAVSLGLHASCDRPEHESKEYFVGFFMAVGSTALYGFILPVVEFIYRKIKQKITYALVMETQIVTSLFATALCTVGMLINADFKAIPREAREFEEGEARYYVLLIWTAINWQLSFLGSVGVIFYASSLLSGVVVAILLPIMEILAVIIFQENFKADKGIALALSLWGFVSYFYGEIKHSENKTQTPQTEIPQV